MKKRTIGVLDMTKLNEKGLDWITFEVNACSAGIDVFRSGTIDENIEEGEAEDRFIIPFNIKIKGIMEEGTKTVDVGYIDGSYFEAPICREIRFLDLCDIVGGDIYAMAEDICDKHREIPDKLCAFDENLVYLNRIRINEAYMNCGIATFAISSLSSLLLYGVGHRCHAIVLKPAPFLLKEKSEAYESEIKRLEKFYSKCGFRRYKKSGHMFKRIAD